ncbi:Modification methylase HpaII [Streptomyces sp. YIM 130001]|uniref:DNA cytosine methyltransferase n=1 Tax=Streptomyces sp. YIM 130001 TaxID=2259644 RepID=UPI000E6479F8|nr:DNA cytosine methyltransferase [Streptomyces sp. YIM 130001]RII19717.1 Modification methylase HpaII [Streptomyces sp. YIM 130001]
MSASGREVPQTTPPLTSIEICAGAGGQAVGLHNAGFKHLALVEYDTHAVSTLRANVGTWPGWGKKRAAALEPLDVKDFLDSKIRRGLGVGKGELDLFAGGVPCPPFSLAGKQLGPDDERDLFPEALKIIEALLPKAVMIENVRGILEPPHVFIEYRRSVVSELRRLGYVVPKVDKTWPIEVQDQVMRSVWRRLDASNFAVPQLRPRAILVAIHRDALKGQEFVWPKGVAGGPVSVAATLEETMRERCHQFWDRNEDGRDARPGDRTGNDVFRDWHRQATEAEQNATGGVGPTLVGGSRKHGGADLGPTRAKRAWEAMGVDATGVANDSGPGTVPDRDLFRKAGPMLTVEQAALIQGFPRGWEFQGKKTARYRQVGNAFPPPVAEAVGRAIAAVLRPELRDALLAGYVMDGGEPEGESGQLSIGGSALSGLPTSSDDNSSDLVGAQ